MAEENNEKLTMACLRTRLESGSDLTVLSSLYIVISLLLQPFKQGLIKSLRSGFRYPFILHVSFDNNLGSIFTHHLDHRIYDTNFRTHISFPFSMCYLSYHLNFSFDAQNLPFIHYSSHVITLPSPVHCRSRNVEGS